MVEPVESVDTVEDLRAADGRVPGRRGRATRQKLLACTAEMLRTTSYRSVKVIDIAREAGTSPATFYQYFADVEAAILVLAQEMALDGQRLVRLVAEGTTNDELLRLLIANSRFPGVIENDVRALLAATRLGRATTPEALNIAPSPSA